MRTCEYIHNFTDIKYIKTLILNKSISKRIYIDKNVHENYDIHFLLIVDPLHDYDTYTTLKVKARNIKYPYLELSGIRTYPYIWEAKTTKINTLRHIEVKFR